MDTNDELKGVQADPVGLKMYGDLFGKEEKEPLIGVREFTINHLFAKIWSRSREPIISLRERSMITVALLAAQGRDEDLRSHIRGARHQGISEPQILEIMIHVSHYAGWSAGNNGQRIALEMFKDEAVA
jgi:4-carboxymuconolactone decarboxylase